MTFFKRTWVTLPGFSVPVISSSALVPYHLDLGMLEQPVLQNALGTEMVAAMHDRHLRCEIGQEQRLLNRGIAAADHHDFLAAIEKAVARGAGRNAKALELFFRVDAQPARLGAGGKDHGFRQIDIATVAGQSERLLVELQIHGKLLDEHNPLEIQGAVVDPDLIELRSGVLIACFGVRVPQKLCWQHPEHPWNGNYLAFSLDHGETWSQVTQVTSGVLTTHYMAVAETPTDNELYVTYDLGGWSKGMSRDVVGRTLKVTVAAD